MGSLHSARRLRTSIVAAVCVAAFAGCGSGAEPVPVDVILSLEATSAQPSAVEAGPVRFVAQNVDVSLHELVVFATNLDVDELPVVAARVDPDAATVTKLGDTGEFRGGETRMLELELEPGRYALVCNVPGHYMLGMVAPLRVR